MPDRSAVSQHLHCAIAQISRTDLPPWITGSSAAPEKRVAPQKQRSQAEDFPMLGKAASSAGRPPAPQAAASVSDSVKAANKVDTLCGSHPESLH